MEKGKEGKRGGGQALMAEWEGLARLIPKIAWKKTLMHHVRFVDLIKLLIHAQSHMSVYLSEPCPPDGYILPTRLVPSNTF